MRKYWREISYGLFVLAGLWIAACKPFQPALDTLGHLAVMGLILSTGIWILEPFHISQGVGSCLLFASMLAVGIPARVVFSGFAQGSVWTLIPALFFGYALEKTGLGKRIAFTLLRLIPKITFFSLTVAWLAIGILLSILTPSITVRIVIAMPLAKSCADLIDLKYPGKERSLLLLYAWSMMVIPGIGWSTGSLLGPVLSGIFSTVEAIPEVTFQAWWQVALLPTLLVTVFLFLFSWAVFRPSLSDSVPNSVFSGIYEKLSPCSRQEKCALFILIGCFLLLATGFFHHIPDAAVCLLSLVLLFLTGVLDREDISKGISWDLVLFVGATMSIGEIFSYTGVSAFLSNCLYPVFLKIPNPVLLILIMLIVLFVWRFVDVALLTPTIVILSPMLPMLDTTHGIHPFVWIPVFSYAICAFFARYQNMFLLVGEASMNGNGWSVRHRVQYSVLYFFACVFAVLLSLPYWRAIGYLSY